MTTPAERYAAFRDRKTDPELAGFRALYDFDFDPFQVEACHALGAGRGVLVAAPTGSGKTVIGEYAVHLALAQGRKCFYTTPIKALSNQKYADLVRRYDSRTVGLLTGDNSINGDAPVVVMTTEVLRNMLYTGSLTLSGLGYVVLDEVHYLADRSRGAVWEEVIIHLPESVRVVALSATVSNAEEFGEWLDQVRGGTEVIVDEHRPVPLWQHVLAGHRLYDLFTDDEHTRVNPELLRAAQRDTWIERKAPQRPGRGGHRPRRFPPAYRPDVISRLDSNGLLPAITFIFSRAGCDAAVEQCLVAGLRLTTPEEAELIQQAAERRTADIPPEDLTVLGYGEWLDGLRRGIAAHHAGMLPAFKEVVEELFAAGLVRAVFATETLALGINMPARTVVIEKLDKWNGETHAAITPGEYTQLTGRAGRRGLDVEGHGVVLWQPGINPREVAGLASTRTYPLRSSFRPSYNMAVNLVHQFGRETSRELLEQSFAQFQADKAVVGLARQLRKSEDALDGYRDAATCHLGDFMEYAALRRRIGEAEKSAARSRREDRREEVLSSLARLRPGDVIDVPAGKFSGYAVVVDPGLSAEGPRPYVVTAERQARRLALMDFPTPVEAVTRLRVPKNFNGRNPQMRRDLASALRSRTHDLAPPYPGRNGGAKAPVDSGTEREINRLRSELEAHPCHACPEREDHARWGERWFKLDRDAKALKRRVEQRTNTVARQFDRVCEVLTALDYLDGDKVTARGAHLRRIYSDMDLVAAESLRHGLWDDLSPSELAAALSVLVFAARRPDDASSPRIPGGPVQEVIGEMVRLWGELDALEREHRLDFLRAPDMGFAWVAYRWAEGDELDDVLGPSDLAAGDFVRWMKQLLDLAGQVADAAGDLPLRETAREVVRRLRRGVVAYSGLTD